MAEYIEREAAVGFLEAISRNADCECISKALIKGAKRLNAMPAADVAPVRHGRWIKDGDFLICLVCETEINKKNSLGSYNSKNYCPNCGARMDGAE